MNEQVWIDKKGREWKVAAFSSFEEANEYDRTVDWNLTPHQRLEQAALLRERFYGSDSNRRSARLYPVLERPIR